MSKCRAPIHIDLTELEQTIAALIQELINECPQEPLEMPPDDTYTKQIAELDRRTDRLMDAFSESCDMAPAYLHRALARLEHERQSILEAMRREKSRPSLPDKLVFASLSFEEKKAVAAQFIRRIDVGDNTAEIFWNV
jgi:hypothetical protein